MKHLIAVLCLVFTASTVYAQDPCASKKYAYTFIDGSCHSNVICTDDPSKLPAGMVAVEKWPNGSMIKYDLENTGINGCVDPFAFLSCVNDAFCAWTSLTNGGTNGSQIINAGWSSSNPSDNSLVHIVGQTNNRQLSNGAHEFGEDDQTVRAVIAVTIAQPLCNGSIITYHDANHRSFIDVNITKTYADASTDVDPLSFD